MNYPTNFFYTKDHEWAKAEGADEVTVGITHHAQEALGEIVFVDLPPVGKVLKEHDTFGVVESIKAVSDLFSPVAGTVVAVNTSATQETTLVNQSPHEKGWLIRLKLSDKNALSKLMKVEEYNKLVESLK